MDRMLDRVFPRLFGDEAVGFLEAVTGRLKAVHLRKGEVLYRQGEPGTGMHLLRTGRLQVRVAADSGAERVVAQVNPGEAVGEIALFTGRGRAATLVAMRDSTLAFLSREDFEAVMLRHPAAQMHLSRYIIERLLDAQRHGSAARQSARTFAVVPLDDGLDAAAFSARLQVALLRFGSVGLLDGRTVEARLPEGFARGTAAADLESYLDSAEADHDYLLLHTDFGLSDWSRKCAAYADAIVFVATADAP